MDREIGASKFAPKTAETATMKTSRYNPRMTFTPVFAAVIHRGEKYLICQRPLNKRHAGLWEFPGGKLEANETYLDAARRELAEELGVEALRIGPRLFSIADPGSVFLIEFFQTEIEGEPRCLEHLALKWMSLQDLATLELAPSDRQFVDFLGRSVPS